MSHTFARLSFMSATCVVQRVGVVALAGNERLPHSKSSEFKVQKPSSVAEEAPTAGGRAPHTSLSMHTIPFPRTPHSNCMA